MRKKTAIVGIGQTEFYRASGRTEWALALEAILAALVDAGVDAKDVDGLIRYSYDNVNPAMVVRALGIPDVRWFGEVPFGGTAQCAVIAQAAAAIEAGIAKVVVVWRALNERSGVRYGRAERHIATDEGLVHAVGDRTPSGQFSGPYGLLVPGQSMALWARRYAYEAGLTDGGLSEVLGTIAVQQRAYANANPHATMRDKPLDMAGYMGSRLIATPLRLYDFCLESDAAAAFVMTSAETAAALRTDPVYVLAAQQSLFPHSEPITVYAEDLMVRTGPGNTDKLFRDAGVGRDQLDFAQVYDATSYTVLSALEEYGFAPRGRGCNYVLRTGLGLDSPLPVNTHGGHLSEGYIHGMNHITEAVRQLRGTASSQVAGAEAGLICSGSSAAILAR